MKPYSVSQVNEYIAKKLRDDYNLRNLPIEGEISGLSRSGPHIYLTLKDHDSMIKCAIWASNIKNIDIRLLENGKKVNVIGDISPYPKGGNYSLSIRYVEAVGEGDLMAEFNRIKQMLEKEGLFDTKYKKSIPSFPYRIGVITSNTGAAIEDIKRTITNKNNFTDILIFPTLVQGIGAAGSIIDNILLANELNRNGLPIDTLIVGRGGGSVEDLMAFNDEGVARAIFASEIPIISAVGHESDFSISDFVADVRAATPTAAAELAVMDTHKLADEINTNTRLLNEALNLKINAERNIIMTNVELLKASMSSKLAEARMSVEKALISLNENNPHNIFNKGYSAVVTNDGTIVSDIDKVKIGNTYKVIISNGSFTVDVKGKENN